MTDASSDKTATATAPPASPPPYVCEGNLRRCRVSMTTRELTNRDDTTRDYEQVTTVNRGWAEISEDGNWLHFADDEGDGYEDWQTFPRIAINWIGWESE